MYVHEKERRDGCYLERIKERMKEGMKMRWDNELREGNCCRHNSCMEEEIKLLLLHAIEEIE